MDTNTVTDIIIPKMENTARMGINMDMSMITQKMGINMKNMDMSMITQKMGINMKNMDTRMTMDIPMATLMLTILMYPLLVLFVRAISTTK